MYSLLVVQDEHLLNATYYSPDIDEQALDSTYGILGPGMSGIGGVMADTSPTHINQLNSTAHHQTANSHVDVTGSVGMLKLLYSTSRIFKNSIFYFVLTNFLNVEMFN